MGVEYISLLLSIPVTYWGISFLSPRLQALLGMRASSSRAHLERIPLNQGMTTSWSFWAPLASSLAGKGITTLVIIGPDYNKEIGLFLHNEMEGGEWD